MLTAKRLRGGNSDFSNRMRYQDAAGVPEVLGDRHGLMAAGNTGPRAHGSAETTAAPAEFACLQMEQVQHQQQHTAAFTTGFVNTPAHQAHHHQHHQHPHKPAGQSLGKAGGQPAGLVMREHGLGSGHLCHQQVQPTPAGSSSVGSPGGDFNMGGSIGHDNCLQRQQPHMATGGMVQQQPGVLHFGAQLPPCPSPGGSSRSGSELARRNMERAHSVNVMMQATVTEALGFLQ